MVMVAARAVGGVRFVVAWVFIFDFLYVYLIYSILFIWGFFIIFNLYFSVFIFSCFTSARGCSLRGSPRRLGRLGLCPVRGLVLVPTSGYPACSNSGGKLAAFGPDPT